MKIDICDYCFGEGKVTEALYPVFLTGKIVFGTCKKHEKKMVKDRNADSNSKQYQDLVALIVKNLSKRGKVFASSKKRK